VWVESAEDYLFEELLLMKEREEQTTSQLGFYNNG
jgi:hypothetical protein